jgi:hypothetical protein
VQAASSEPERIFLGGHGECKNMASRAVSLLKECVMGVPASTTFIST